MFQYDSYFDWKKGNGNTSEDQEKKVNLFAVHFRRLEGYTKEWKLQKILLYEYMLVCGRIYGHKNFTQKTSMIVKATLMGKDTIYKYLKEFEKAGYIKIKREKADGTSKLNRYTIDYECIKDSLEDIYDFGNLEEQTIKAYKQDLCNWYDYHSSSSYRDAPNNSDEKSETQDSEDNSIRESIT